ncbi:MAG: ferredoxin [Candidatus Methanoperedenaceae archaeon]|nr:MAG: ferredoxin [Candidatus Methanoperedenaceae archaeon]
MKNEGFIIVLGCKKCGKCNGVCETGALTHVDGIAGIDQEKCSLCMRCVRVCPNKALVYLD